jgi:cellulose biosynthesis protein BcsQ
MTADHNYTQNTGCRSNYATDVRVISFVSAKGGAGKTSISIGTATMLAEAGLRVALVDFDLATHGASYFFNNIEKQGLGISELIKQHIDLNAESNIDTSERGQWDFGYSELARVNIGNNFQFIPSRVKLIDSAEIQSLNPLNEHVLESFLAGLIEEYLHHYDLVLIDNQASVNKTSAVSMRLAERIVIVQEFDQISIDAVVTFCAQSDFNRSIARHLINKVADSEYAQYNIISDEHLANQNHLRPLPYDHAVRRAFGTRKVPIDVKNPSSFHLALHRTAKGIFKGTSLDNRLSDYGKRLLEGYHVYYERKEDLLKKRAELSQQREKVENQNFLKSRRSKKLMGIGLFVTVLGIAAVFWKNFFGNVFWEWTTIAAVMSIAFIGGCLFGYAGTWQTILTEESREERAKRQAKLDAINTELDNFKSLLNTEDPALLTKLGIFPPPPHSS